MPCLCATLSCFVRLVRDSLCSRPVSVLNLHHPPLLFSMFRMSFPALPLTPSLQQASFPALIPFCFLLLFFPLTLVPPVLPHFSSSCPYLAFCMASSPHISMLSTPPYPLPGSLAGLFSSRCVLPVCTWVSTDSPSCSCFPCPSYQYPNFFSAPSCVHILHAWKKEPPGRLKPSPVVLVFFPQEGACTFG